MIVAKENEYGSGYGQYYDLDENIMYESCYEEELYVNHLDQEEQLMMYQETRHVRNDFFRRPLICFIMLLTKWLR